jgi:hypothetical protein
MKSILFRVGRSALALATTIGTAALTGNPKWLWLLPVLQGVGKGARMRWPKSQAAHLFPF